MRATYTNSKEEVSIRAETLRPAAEWQRPTSGEVRQLIRLTGLKGSEVADLLGLAAQNNRSGRGSRTVRRWVSGDTPIPYAAWAILAHKAGFGIIWTDAVGTV